MERDRGRWPGFFSDPLDTDQYDRLQTKLADYQAGYEERAIVDRPSDFGTMGVAVGDQPLKDPAMETAVPTERGWTKRTPWEVARTP